MFQALGVATIQGQCINRLVAYGSAQGGIGGVYRWDLLSHGDRLSLRDYLIHQVTVEDPLVLAKPWNSAPRKWSLSVVADDDLEEFFCTTNEEPQEWRKEGRPSNVQLGTPPDSK